MAAPLPLAAGEWLEALLPFLFLLFWIVSQIRNLFRGGDQARPRGPVVVRPAARPPDADEARRELARQVEEFLRRSSGEAAPGRQAGPRRGTAPRPPGGGPTPRRTAAPPPLPAEAPRPRSDAAPRGPRPAAAPAPVLGSLGGHGGDVARHVDDAFARDLAHLASGGGRSETEMPASAAATGAAATIATLLRDPGTLRQLVLVREVLDRPVDRW